MSNVAALARDWLLAKQAEQKSIDHRIAIEEQLAAALGVRDEGSETHKIPGYNVTITQPVYRKVDETVWETVAQYCPPDRHPIKHRLEVDVSGVRWLMVHEPKIWQRIAKAFTTTPGKVGVRVEVKKGEEPKWQ